MLPDAMLAERGHAREDGEVLDGRGLGDNGGVVVAGGFVRGQTGWILCCSGRTANFLRYYRCIIRRVLGAVDAGLRRLWRLWAGGIIK